MYDTDKSSKLHNHDVSQPYEFFERFWKWAIIAQKSYQVYVTAHLSTRLSHSHPKYYIFIIQLKQNSINGKHNGHTGRVIL